MKLFACLTAFLFALAAAAQIVAPAPEFTGKFHNPRR
jgi:hypothetical protein